MAATDRDTIDSVVPVDFSDATEAEQAIRIGRAWIEMRRGAWAQRMRDHFFADGEPIEAGQMDALDLLSRRDRTMRELADRLRIDPSTATRAAQRLVENGLAERSTAPDDGRVKIVRISDEGRRRHAAFERRRNAMMAQLLGEFSAAERSELADLLERFVTSLDRIVDTFD